MECITYVFIYIYIYIYMCIDVFEYNFTYINRIHNIHIEPHMYTYTCIHMLCSVLTQNGAVCLVLY